MEAAHTLSPGAGSLRRFCPRDLDLPKLFRAFHLPLHLGQPNIIHHRRLHRIQPILNLRQQAAEHPSPVLRFFPYSAFPHRFSQKKGAPHSEERPRTSLSCNQTISTPNRFFPPPSL